MNARLLLGCSLLLLSACRSAIDPDQALEFPCQRDGGAADQCPSGWYCGVEGYCYSRAADAGVARRCESTDDCAEGWRCGISGLCQSTSTAAAYPCAEDSHCEQQWRCGPDGRCVDPLADALPFERFWETPLNTVKRITPKLTYVLPPVVAVSAPIQTSVVFEYARTFTWERSDQILHLLYSAPLAPDAGSTTRTRLAELPLEAVTDGGPLEAVAASRKRAYLLHSNGTQLTVWDPFGAGTTSTLTLPAPASALYATWDTEAKSLVVAYGPSALSLYAPASGALSQLTLPLAVDGGPVTVLDVAGLVDYHADEALLLATDHGTYLGRRGSVATDVSWAPLQLPELGHPACGPVDAIVDRLAAPQGVFYGDTRLYAEAVSGDGGTKFAAWALPLRASASVLDAGNGCLALDAGSILIPLTAHPCGADARFEGLLRSDDQPNRLEGWCRMRPDAGGRTWTVRTGPVDGGRFAPLPGGSGQARYFEPFTPTVDDYTDVRFSESAGSASGFMNAEGQLVYEDGTRVRRVQPMTAPVAVQGAGEALEATYARVGEHSRWLDYYQRDDNVGLTGGDRFTSRRGEVLAQVSGAVDWIVLAADPEAFEAVPYVQRLKADGLHGVVARFPSSEAFKAPFSGTLAPAADGGTLLLVGAFDAVLAADVTGWSMGSPRQLEVVSVPSSRSPLLSIAPLRPTPPNHAEAYALTRSGLFRLTASGPIRWRTEELAAPGGASIQVWADSESRGRLGFEDGTIYALPSRVRIAEPFSDGAIALRFATRCDQPFALTTHGLYRLLPQPGGVVGAWQKISHYSSAPYDERAVLHFTDDGLYVFTGSGEVDHYPVKCGEK